MDVCLDSYTHKYVPDLLKGKVAFITGGGSGIGFRIAELFMRHGCDCVIASRSLSRVEEAAVGLREGTGRKCLPIKMDVRKYPEVENAVREAMREFGKIDILVNNAAGNFLCPVSGMSSNAFKTVMEIDTLGTFNLSKCVYTHCFSQPDRSGVILNISATLHYQGVALQAHVGAAKAAIDALTKHLAVEWGPEGIRVNAVAPGPISGTEGMRKLRGDVTDQMITANIPLQKIGTRTEVAETAVFLCSCLADNITGEILVVDGGSKLTSGNESYHRLRAFRSKL
ncbi:Peroxisomal 2,4-dienoyl-CoA reductase isoform X1 [Oopsacas minuta]|uniref:Peroxisomal 2,4-dienoyl-CoA reductase [(3E)-enoyl-CoA-producing] n=1 Tax=Oopsacas minuta TaxID=111878 RepID=A0AAV7JDH7_9METZ|nr:Peroxisomal 2,4-dienoyl-CoA reductase isoform X1 [Oopsacas minuta]